MRTYEFNGDEFENEVRNVARLLWPSSTSQGAGILQNRERDGVFETEDIIYIIEATTKTTKDKIEYDAKKTDYSVKHLRKNSGKHAKGYIINLNEPTADQRAVAKNYSRSLDIMSFSEFRSRLVDAHRYIELRKNKPFGSVYDYALDTHVVSRETFVEPTITEYSSGAVYRLSEISASLEEANCFVLLAEYGTGKSMCLKELFSIDSKITIINQHLNFLSTST